MTPSKLQVAVVFSVGNTEGGCEFALRWILREAQSNPHLFFFYGHAAPGQTQSPLSAVHKILANPEFSALPRGGECATNAYSLDRAYSDSIEFVRTIESRGFTRVYIGITGGTNPMVAALFHAAMNELTCEVIPIYVQAVPASGGTQNSIELISGVRTRDAILIERVLGLARHGQLTAARALAENLPQLGRPGFIRRAILALASWDNFDYRAASEIRELAARGTDFAGDPLLQPLLLTLEHYRAIVHRLAEMETAFRSPVELAKASQQKGWEHMVKNSAFWLPLDALANGWRRLEEGRATDAVMRAYRAVEIAIHCRLFALGVHPSGLRWDATPLKEVAPRWPAQLGPVPDTVALEHAFELLSLLTGSDLSDTLDSRRKIQSCRNHTYLEHGYNRVEAETGKTILAQAGDLVNRILWKPCLTELTKLKMIF